MPRLNLAPAAIALALMVSPAVAGSGSFSGASGHATKGSVSVSQSGGKIVIKLGGNFSFDGAPDPYVALGNGSKPAKGGLVAVLRKNNGAQSYSIAATPALKNATRVIIWCKKYAVPLGVAKVK